MIGDEVEEVWAPPGLEVAVYEVIAEPPLFVGGVNATETLVCEAGVATNEVGAEGTEAAKVVAEFDTVAGDRPIPFRALTENV
jgi:hypothetical protein